MAGALDATGDRLVWVAAAKKNSSLFIALLEKLLQVCADRSVIHMILDNYGIHSSRQTQAWLAEHAVKLRLHFLPPYCPDDNRIARRVWRELHANVTRNHTCDSMQELLHEVSYYLQSRNRAAIRRWLRCAWGYLGIPFGRSTQRLVGRRTHALRPNSCDRIDS